MEASLSGRFRSSVRGGGGGLFAQGLKARSTAGPEVTASPIALMDFPSAGAGH